MKELLISQVGLYGESAWLLISDGQIKALNNDTRLGKTPPLKYLESFKEYSPDFQNKIVVLSQGDKL